MRLITEDERFRATLIYTVANKAKVSNFDQLTINAIAQIIEKIRDEASSISEVYVNGPTPPKQLEYSKAIRDSGVKNTRLHRANIKREGISATF